MFVFVNILAKDMKLVFMVLLFKRNFFKKIVYSHSLIKRRKSIPDAKIIWQFECSTQEDLWTTKCQYKTIYLSVFLKGSLLNGGIFIFFISNWIMGLISEFEITVRFLIQELDPKHSIQWIFNRDERFPTPYSIDQ